MGFKKELRKAVENFFFTVKILKNFPKSVAKHLKK